MNSTEEQAFIKKNSALFWYIPEEKRRNITPEVLVEFVLNFGDIDSVKQLIRLYGLKEVADIFFRSINISNRRKENYHELTLHFFTLFFNRYAYGNS